MRILALLRKDEPVHKDAGSVESAFFDYLADLAERWDIEYVDPVRYELCKLGRTESGTDLWLASEYVTYWVSIYIIENGGTPEVFVAMSEKRDELYLRDDVKDGVTAEVIKELGFDAKAWGDALLSAVQKSEQVATVPSYTVVKADEAQQYTLGVAYPANELDSHGDFTTPSELEKAAWDYIVKSRNVGTDHKDGTDGAATVVESYIYRGPDWETADKVIKDGDWMIGAVWTDDGWDRVQKGDLNGWSIQGLANIDPDADEPDGDR